MFRTVTLAIQPRILRIFVDIRSAKVCKPCLYISARDNMKNPVTLASWWNVLPNALRSQLFMSAFGRILVRVNRDNQQFALRLSNGLQFSGITFSDPLFAGLGAVRKREGMKVPSAEFS